MILQSFIGLKSLSLAWNLNSAIPMNEQKSDYLLRLPQWTCIYIYSLNSHNNYVKQELLASFYRWGGFGFTKNQMIEQREPIAHKWHSQEFSVFFHFTTLPFPHPNTTPLHPDNNSWLLFMPCLLSLERLCLSFDCSHLLYLSKQPNSHLLHDGIFSFLSP